MILKISQEQLELVYKYTHDRRTGAIITDGSNAYDCETILGMLGLLDQYMIWEYREKIADRAAKAKKKLEARHDEAQRL